jgi:hypothetical protein
VISGPYLLFHPAVPKGRQDWPELRRFVGSSFVAPAARSLRIF